MTAARPRRAGGHNGGVLVADDYAARIQAWEDAHLSPLAARSYPAVREREEDECGLRTPFQRDRDRIVHSKAFRRLKHKTQVFVAPEGDHYRTRLTHTLEATQISRTVARALRLNEDLTEAVGLGHDVGHPPFGHIGEAVLDACGRERFGRGFRHNEHSLRVVEKLEALNLTAAVRDGILRHSSGAGEPVTLEGKIVRLVDRIAYINHDIDDALRAGVLAAYIEKKIIDRSPFETIDKPGVGWLVRLASWVGREAKPQLKLGICGEHGGDPESIDFFHMAGLDYVSCSPYRVPIARVAAAQAQIAHSS